MTASELNQHFRRYTLDHDYAHHLFQATIAYARERINSNNPDREEIIMDTAWSAWEHYATLPTSRDFTPWFHRALRNKTTDYRRKSQTRSRYEESAVFCEPTFSLEERANMRQSAGKHEPLIDLLLDGWSIEEAATLLGVSSRSFRERLLSLKKDMAQNA